MVDNFAKTLIYWKYIEYFTPQYPELRQLKPLESLENEKNTGKICGNSHNMIYLGKLSVDVLMEKIANSMGRTPIPEPIAGDVYVCRFQISNRSYVENSFQVSPFFYAASYLINGKKNRVKNRRDNLYEEIIAYNQDMERVMKCEFDSIKQSDLKIKCSQLYEKVCMDCSDKIADFIQPYEAYSVELGENDVYSASDKSFYIEDIEKNIQEHKVILNTKGVLDEYVEAFYRNENKKEIDSDEAVMRQWLQLERQPLGKWPSPFSPNLMQQLAINIGIAESGRQKKIFSVNGPPGTGKTTLLKEIIASNVVSTAVELCKLNPEKTDNMKDVSLITEGKRVENVIIAKIPEKISRYGILVTSNGNDAVENITMELPKAEDVTNEKLSMPLFDRNRYSEIYFSETADELLQKDSGAWGLISAKMGKKDNNRKVAKILGEDELFFRKFLARDVVPWKEAKKRFQDAKKAVEEKRRSIESDIRKYQSAVKYSDLNVQREIGEKYGSSVMSPDFFVNIQTNKESQSVSPWTDKEYDNLRIKLFWEALQLRKSFIQNSPGIQNNLKYMGRYLNGQFRINPQDEKTVKEKDDIYAALFQTLFLLIPVISTTFASINTFLKPVKKGRLGLLIVDEAGQATPQSAVGALWRCRKAIIVGDPLQVEPISKVPIEIMDLIGTKLGVDSHYMNVSLSVQDVADRTNEFIGKIGEREVGCPLVIHRRCEDPMFSISNEISYGNRMFNMTNPSDGETFCKEKSCWINVKGKEEGGKNHYVKNQGEEVLKIFAKAEEIYGNSLFEVGQNKLYVISPFKSVARKVQYLLKGFYDRHVSCGEKGFWAWSRKCVGTVHTFQGKEAREVIFVLGCDKSSKGAVQWVNSNIVNVAATRAKHRFYMIGDEEVWRESQVVNTARGLLGCKIEGESYPESEKEDNTGLACKAQKITMSEERVYCPKCKIALVKRTGKYGEFYGCRNFPECKYTWNKK